MPRFVERCPPVGADDVAAGVAQIAEDAAGTDAEMNRRHAVAPGVRRVRADAIEDLLRVRQDELAIVGRVQGADPRVEHLHGVDAGFDLRDEVLADHIGDRVAEAMPRGRPAVHQCFGVRERVRMPAFDRI